MGIFSDHLTKEVRMERMRPSQIEAAIKEFPTVYITFSPLEWHGRQNPIGTDLLEFYEIMIKIASTIGGVVFPPIYLGCGGPHATFPFTYMVDTITVESVAYQILKKLDADGFKRAIFSPMHGLLAAFHNYDCINRAAQRLAAEGAQIKVVIAFDWAMSSEGLPGVDHAARAETSLMMYLYPETVSLDELSGKSNAENTGESVVHYVDKQYKDDPLYGICGLDPRKTASKQWGQNWVETYLQCFYNRFFIKPFITTFQISKMMPSAGKLNGLPYPTDKAPLTLRPRTFPDYFCNFGSSAPQDVVVYYLLQLHCPTDMTLRWCFGYDGPIKAWEDGAEIFHDPEGVNPASPGKAHTDRKTSRGDHELLIALGSNGGGAHGIFLQCERLDVTTTDLKERMRAFPLPDFDL